MKKDEYNICKNLAKLCGTRYEFQKKHRTIYRKALKNKWLDEICSHMKSGRITYSYDFCKHEAKKYKTRKEFELMNRGCYEACLRNKWLDLVALHMPKQGNYSLQECKEKALLCSTRHEFQKKYGGYYKKAIRKKWINKVCSHMPKFAKQNRREEALQKQIYRFLKEQFKKYNIYPEYKIYNENRIIGSVDFLIKHKENKKVIAIEVKHSESTWTKTEINNQINKYKKYLGKTQWFQDVILISDNGKYGFEYQKLKDLIPQ